MASPSAQRIRGRPRKHLKNKAAKQNLHALKGGKENRHNQPSVRQRGRDMKNEFDTEFKQLIASTVYVMSAGNQKFFEEWLTSYGEDDAESLLTLEHNCTNIAKILRARRPSERANITPELLQSLNKYFVYRTGPRNIQLLKPVDVFDTQRELTKKTLGFVRDHGDDWPMMYALSGIKSCGNDPKMLDNVLWSKLSLDYGNKNNVESRCNGWEIHQGSEKGMQFAGHAERKLMLWYACDMLERFVKKGDPPHKQLKMLHELNGRVGAGNPVHVEVVLNRLPCQNCLQFRDMLQQVIFGLKFHFILIPTLGRVKLQKIWNQHSFPLISDEVLQASEDSDSDNESPRPKEISSERLISSKTASRCQVVIPATPRTQLRDHRVSAPLRGAPHPNSDVAPATPQKKHVEYIDLTVSKRTISSKSGTEAHKDRQPSLVRETITTLATTSKKTVRRQLKEFMFKDPSTSAKHTYFKSESESDYEQTQVKASKSRNQIFQPYTPPSSTRTAPTVFDANPFSLELQAEQLKNKKRRQELETQASPSVSRKQKKSRHS